MDLTHITAEGLNGFNGQLGRRRAYSVDASKSMQSGRVICSDVCFSVQMHTCCSMGLMISEFQWFMDLWSMIYVWFMYTWCISAFFIQHTAGSFLFWSNDVQRSDSTVFRTRPAAFPGRGFEASSAGWGLDPGHLPNNGDRAGKVCIFICESYVCI